MLWNLAFDVIIKFIDYFVNILYTGDFRFVLTQSIVTFPHT